ncbi:Uncharacterised protein [Vibrio cholerae]|nr:Uncharacterised protein [Vibrio cholerae]CSI65063.1 Uncharacterised protein [Vibrio cholerae]
MKWPRGRDKFELLHKRQCEAFGLLTLNLT